MKSSTKAQSSIISQFIDLLLLIFKLKTRRMVLMVIPLALILLSTRAPGIVDNIWSHGTAVKRASETNLEFFDTFDLDASGKKILLDRPTSPTETSTLARIVTERGGKANWLKDCTPDAECRAQFISEIDASVMAYIRYATSTSHNRTTLECRWSNDVSSQRCAFLYQLMAQSMLHSKESSGVFKDVIFFTLNNIQGFDRQKKVKKISLPESICSKWINDGPYVFRRMLHFSQFFALFLVTMGQVFYFLTGTLTCVRSLKTNGFLRLLVRSGLSPVGYWTVLWLLTALECAFFTGAYILSYLWICPGVFSGAVLGNTYIFLCTHFFCVVALMLLLELLIKPIMTISLLAVGFILLITVMPFKDEKAFYNLPLFFASNYTVASMTDEMWRKVTDEASDFEKNGLHRYQLAAMIVSALLIMLVTGFTDCVLPAGNSLCLPLSFPFSCRFWRPSDAKSHDFAAISDRKTPVEPHVEPVIDGSASIIIDNVSKTYITERYCRTMEVPVLKELSCKIYKNQITALIGHNGAGKSTLIRIITGEEVPDRGAAYVNGIKVTDPFERLALRGRITICPQFDALCSDVTVLESIRLTLNCTGALNSAEVEKARTMLQRLGLGDKENVKATDLSGGQKRKVNTILALLGDPDVIVLDEPTSGLDPVSRRQLWQLLQEEKVGRSIVLCTQFMDEADLLANRKIFLSGGQIVCAGSSMFLKRAFGCSFELSVSLKSKSDASKVQSALRGVQLRSQSDTELQFEVATSKLDVLIGAVQVLESSKDIEAFGLSQASLDDIFMKLSGVDSAQVIDAFRSGELSKVVNKTQPSIVSRNRVELTQSLLQSKGVQASISQQFCALLRNNLRRQVRTKSSIYSRFIIPALILLFLMYAVARGMTDYMTEKEEARKDRKLLATDSSSRKSKVRAVEPLYFDEGLRGFGRTCLHDRENPKVEYATPCYGLTKLSNKSDSTGVRDFLAQTSTIERLVQDCPERDDACVIFYASSWNKNESNNQRTIAIGIALSRTPSIDIVHVFRRAFVTVSEQLGAGDVAATTSLAQIRPFNQYKAFEIEMIVFLCIFCLFPVSYLSDPIEDMASRVRSHLLSMGMSYLAYWINTFLLHWIQYSVCFVLSVSILSIWDRYSNPLFQLVCLPLWAFGTVSNQLTLYTIAAIAKKPDILLFLSCNLLALALPIVFIALSLSGKIVVLLLICLLPPMAPIALVYYTVLYSIYTIDYYRVNHVSDVPNLYKNCFSIVYIPVSIIAMPVHICILCFIIAFFENRTAICAGSFHQNVTPDSNKSDIVMDQGALKEADRVMQSTRNGKNVLEVRQLNKTYLNGVKAVRGTTFGAMTGEIFGLLGANGAGKTTTMSVIVGEESPTSGECEVRLKDGVWVSGRAGAPIGAIGYCPQHNPLYDNVSVTEHIRLYANIRGVPIEAADRQVNALIQSLGLEPHRDKFAGQLSGGNKRRLCLAIALLGDPVMVVIDEASTGVDPENKRFIWDAIRGMLHDQRSVMVTTHSMEEVEALCSRVGIMDKGRMIALGTVQQLRSLYGTGYTLELLLKNGADVKATQQQKQNIKDVLSSQFKGTVLLEDLSAWMQFFIPKASVTRLSIALRYLAANQSKLAIEYFSMYQMSLDQVFVRLIKQFASSS